MSDDYLYRVSVYLKGDGLDPDAVTSLLAVNPTQSHRKGDKWLTSTRKEVVEKTGLWSLSVEPGSRDLSEILGELSSKICKKNDSLANVSGVEEAYVDVFVAVDADDLGGGGCEFELDVPCVRALSNLQLPIRFTVTVVRE